MRFVGRTAELAGLDAQWRKREAQLMILTGKRRVGKTFLLNRWLQKKPAVYYLADRPPEREQLRDLAKRLGAHFPVHQVGRWRDHDHEIDVLGVNAYANGLLLGEAKWSTQPVGVDVLAGLQAKGRTCGGAPPGDGRPLLSSARADSRRISGVAPRPRGSCCSRGRVAMQFHRK